MCCRQGSSSCNPIKAVSMEAVLARLGCVQQTTQNAIAASQAAAAVAQRAESKVLDLQKQNAQLKDRIVDLETKQKVPGILLLLLLSATCIASLMLDLSRQ